MQKIETDDIICTIVFKIDCAHPYSPEEHVKKNLLSEEGRKAVIVIQAKQIG